MESNQTKFLIISILINEIYEDEYTITKIYREQPDESYYALFKNGEPFYQDSANEDTYDLETACAAFSRIVFDLLPSDYKYSINGLDYLQLIM